MTEEFTSNVYTLAERIIEGRVFKTVNAITYVFGEGIYEPADHLIEEEVLDKLKNGFTIHKLRNIKKAIAIRTYTKEEMPPLNLIPLKNKIYDVDTGKTTKYSPKYFFTYKHSFDFDPSALCPTIDKFLLEVVNPRDRQILEEFIGYCFLRDYRFHKALILLGSGSNGKTTFLNVLYKLFDKHNTVSISLQDLLTRKFMTIQLKDKVANIYDDIPSKPLKYTGLIKVLTGEGTVTADRKNKDPITFKNYAKLIFACNKLPKSEDDSMAFYDRIILILFPHKFDKDKADRQILSKMIPELPGLFNASMGRLRMLLKRGFFRVSTTEKRYMQLSNSSLAFFEEMIEPDQGELIIRDELWAEYLIYCKEKSLVPESRRFFIRKINKYIKQSPHDITISRPEIKGKRVYTYIGIKIKGVEANA